MKIRKSVPGFVFGLLGGLGLLLISTLSVFLGSLLIDVGINASNTLTILSWVAFGGSIIGLIGTGLCFKKARAGGIMMLISAISAGTFLGWTIYQLITLNINFTTSIITTLIFSAIPFVLVLVGAISALIAKQKKKRR